MPYTDWLPALTTTSLLGVAVWLGKNVIVTRLKKSVENEFDRKLESVRSDLRSSEERLKAELRTKEAEIAALRNNLMNTMATRQIALEKRRLDAAEAIWSSVVTELAPAKTISGLMAVMNVKVAAELSQTNTRVREMFDMFGSGCDLKKLNTTEAHKARPFVSPMVWAVFSAYATIAIGAVIRCQSIKAGVSSDLLDHAKLKKLIEVALPQRVAHMEKWGEASYNQLLVELEEKLLNEITTMLSGQESDKATLNQAAMILKEAEAVTSGLQAKLPGV